MTSGATALVREEEGGSTEELVAARAGWCGRVSPHSQQQSPTEELGVLVLLVCLMREEGARPDEEADLVHSNGRSRRGNRSKLQLFVVKRRGFGFVLWQKFRGECLGQRLLGKQAVN